MRQTRALMSSVHTTGPQDVDILQARHTDGGRYVVVVS
jgi:hypothetical protein